MVTVANISWQNNNALRSYPLDDAATLQTDAGDILPSGILTDLNIWIPPAYGSFAAIGAITVSSALVSVVICGCTTRGANSQTGDSAAPATAIGAAVAYVTLPLPIIPGKNYALTPMVTGAAGWISLGNSVNTMNSAKFGFSTDIQAPILPRLTHSYNFGAVPYASTDGSSTKLTGIVKLASNNPDLTIKSAYRIINGECRKAIVFSLNTDPAPGLVPPLQSYVLPCDKTPESGTCNGQPIYGINGVAPDCNGNLTILFEAAPGGASLLPVPTGNGVALEYGLGMSAACGVTSSYFILSQEVTDNCNPSPCVGFTGATPSSSSYTPPPPGPYSSCSVNAPYTDSLEPPGACWNPVVGTWGDVSLGYGTDGSLYPRALAVLEGSESVVYGGTRTFSVGTILQSINPSIGTLSDSSSSLNILQGETIQSCVALSVFDSNNYYFCGIDYKRQAVVVGHVALGSIYYDVLAPATVNISTSYTIQVNITDNTDVTVSVPQLGVTQPISLPNLGQGPLGLMLNNSAAVFLDFDLAT